MNIVKSKLSYTKRWVNDIYLALKEKGIQCDDYALERIGNEVRKLHVYSGENATFGMQVGMRSKRVQSYSVNRAKPNYWDLYCNCIGRNKKIFILNDFTPTMIEPAVPQKKAEPNYFNGISIKRVDFNNIVPSVFDDYNYEKPRKVKYKNHEHYICNYPINNYVPILNEREEF